MNGFTAEDRAAMQESVRRLLAAKNAEADVRRAMETPSGFDAELWEKLVELGVAGLIVDSAHDGLGGGPVELELIMEEAGGALLCAPFLGSAVLSAALVTAAGDAAAKAKYLPGIASGRIAAAAITGEAGTWTPEGVAVTAAGDTLNGVASFVLNGAVAEDFFVAAREGDGFGVFHVAKGASGLEEKTLQTFDRTLRLSKLTFANVKGARIGGGWPAVDAALKTALVALAGEQAGGARRVLDFTVEYAKTRIQFGRPIGSFQAIKHMAADLLIETESCISAARAAAQALADAPDGADEAVSLAAFACADAYSKVTADAVQMHGGIAFTWEHPAHLYLRRARAGAQLFGGSNYHRERFLTAMGG